jgi:hypothetical protein
MFIYTALAGDDDEEEEAGGEEDAKKVDKLGNQVVGEPQIERVSYSLNIFIFKGDFPKLPWINEMNARFRIIIKEGEYINSLV